MTALEIAARAIGLYGPNDDARCAVHPDALSAVASHVNHEYGCEGYRVGIVGPGVFSVRTSDGSTFYLAADRWGNVERVADDYIAASAREARDAGYGDASYWAHLEASAREHAARFKREGDGARAEEMLTRSLADALAGNDGE